MNICLRGDAKSVRSVVARGPTKENGDLSPVSREHDGLRRPSSPPGNEELARRNQHYVPGIPVTSFLTGTWWMLGLSHGGQIGFVRRRALCTGHSAFHTSNTPPRNWLCLAHCTLRRSLAARTFVLSQMTHPSRVWLCFAQRPRS
jgi:hypothetical protein